MKYNIQINQLILHSTPLDMVDCGILDYLIFYCNSSNEKVDKQRVDGWTWITYQSIIKDMPLLRLKSIGALTPRIRRIESAGYIGTKRIGNQRLYVKLTPKVDELFIKVNRAVHEDEQSCSPKRMNNTTIDNTTIIKNNVLFDSFWSLYPKKEKKKKAQELWKKKKLDSSYNEIEDFIKKALQTERWAKGYVPHPTTFINEERWKDDIMGYGEIKRKPYYDGFPMQEKNGRWFVIKGGEWFEFADKESKIEWRS